MRARARRPARRCRRPAWRRSTRSAGASRAGADRSSIASSSRAVSSAPGTVGLVHDEHVGDLHEARLVRLHRVAPTRVHDHDRRVGVARDLDLHLPDADRLDDDPGLPAASSTRTACGVASARPPRWPRVAIERMNTPGSVACSCMRTRSPRIAPPLNGLVGSIASTPTSSRRRGAARDDQPVGERRLARAGRAGDADDPGMARVPVVAGASHARAADRPARRWIRRGERAAVAVQGARRPARRRSGVHERRPVGPATRRVRSALGLVGDDLGDAGNPVHDDPLDAGLQRHRRHRARAARPDQRDVHHAVVVDAPEDDVATVGLERRPDRSIASRICGFQRGEIEGHTDACVPEAPSWQMSRRSGQSCGRPAHVERARRRRRARAGWPARSA